MAKKPCLSFIVFSVYKKNSWTYSSTACPRSSNPFYILSYKIKWVISSWTYSTQDPRVIRTDTDIIPDIAIWVITIDKYSIYIYIILECYSVVITLASSYPLKSFFVMVFFCGRKSVFIYIHYFLYYCMFKKSCPIFIVYFHI